MSRSPTPTRTSTKPSKFSVRRSRPSRPAREVEEDAMTLSRRRLLKLGGAALAGASVVPAIARAQTRDVRGGPGDVRRSRARRGLGPCADHRAPHPAKRPRDGHHSRDHRPRHRDPRRVGALVPRLRRAAAVSGVGRDALGFRPYLHVPRAVDGDLARRRDLTRGVRVQYARRRATRHPRPPAAWRCAVMRRGAKLGTAGLDESWGAEYRGITVTRPVRAPSWAHSNPGRC